MRGGSWVLTHIAWTSTRYCGQSHNFVGTQCRVALDAQKLGVHHAFMGHHIIAGGAPRFVAGLSR